MKRPIRELDTRAKCERCKRPLTEDALKKESLICFVCEKVYAYTGPSGPTPEPTPKD